MKTNTGLVKHCELALKSKWGYVWGTFGNVLTESLLQQKLRQYPRGVGNYISFIRQNWLGRRTADCVGLIKSYYWLNESTGKIMYKSSQDTSADGMYARAKVKGPIRSIPEKPGICVRFKGHIGVYIGNGYVIEAKGTKYGVVKTKLKNGAWTHWLECPYISYSSEPKPLPVEKPKEDKLSFENAIIPFHVDQRNIDVRGFKVRVNNSTGVTQYIALRDLESIGYTVEWSRDHTTISKSFIYSGSNLNLIYDLKSVEKAIVPIAFNGKVFKLDGFKLTDKHGRVTQFIAVKDMKHLGVKVMWDSRLRQVILQ